MKTAIKTLGFIGLTIVLLFVVNQNKEIRKYKAQEKNQIEFLDTLQIELDSLKTQLKNMLNVMDSIPLGSPLDTLVLMDDFGVRKHPILGGWQMHSGVDLIDTYRDTIYATGSGKVVQSGRYFGYGNCIQIEHSFGFKTKYAHLHKIFVKRGENIEKGQPIGIMGETGLATGQHLHYEIIHDSKAIDPLPYIKVDATMYHPVEAQCDDDPLVTADGSIIDPYQVSDWNWIAVSQDMLKKNGGIFEYGDKVYIKGSHKEGIYTIHDCMNRRFTHKIDFLENIGTPQYRYNDLEIYALNE